MNATTPDAIFLFTDIEGSTRLWETEPTRMADALARHDQLCRATVEAHSGRLVKMTGDGLHAVFDDPASAVAATVDLQHGMAAIGADCGISFKMRCGLHAGIAQERDSDYFGSAVNRAARIMGAAHGGQVLLSQVVVDLGRKHFPDGTDLMHLGRVRLRDLSAPEDVWQLLYTDLPRTFPPLRSLDSTPNNLPQQLTSFIGREQEMAQLKHLLGRTRLLTVTGSGGCGKTRLAMQVAADLLDSYPDGIWLVELAALADPALVPQAIATVLGLKEDPGKSLALTLTEHLKSRHLLMVLDNAEHLLATCAQLADSVLRQCPQVVVLVSSREALGIGGELTYRVPSLSTPDPKRDATAESLSRYHSVRLFVERAQFHLPQFAVTEKNAPALASICSRLDGIPLALELAAARVRSLSVEEVDRRLDQRFQLLTGGSRTALPRQQTLRSLIDWSYDLLRDAEKALLCRLSVFAGGWTLEAAEHVCSGQNVDDEEVLDLLTSLIDKSLAVTEERDGTTRYRLLETVRQYAREKLVEARDGVTVRERHRNYFLALAKEAEPKLGGADTAAWLRRLEEEHENLRASLNWSLVEAGSRTGLQLCRALHRFWWARGYLSEGREWCVRILGKAGAEERTQERADALQVAGVLAYHQGDYPAACALDEESLAIRRQLGDRKGIAASLNNLGLVACDQRDYAAARALYEESLAIKRELGDRPGVANSLNNLGNVAYDQAQFSNARALYEESLAIARELGDREGVARILGNLGNVAMHGRDFASARALHEESLAIKRELGYRQRIGSSLNSLGNLASDQGDFASAAALHREGLMIVHDLGDRLGTAISLEGLATVVGAQGSSLCAARIWGAADRLREEIGASMPPRERPRYDPQVAAARAALGDDAAFELAWQEGRAMSLELAIEYALEEKDV